MESVKTVAVFTALVAVVVAAALVIGDHVNCFNWFGLVKGCSVH